nr:unnamed protein product [Digitaria exilis]
MHGLIDGQHVCSTQRYTQKDLKPPIPLLVGAVVVQRSLTREHLPPALHTRDAPSGPTAQPGACILQYNREQRRPRPGLGDPGGHVKLFLHGRMEIHVTAPRPAVRDISLPSVRRWGQVSFTAATGGHMHAVDTLANGEDGDERRGSSLGEELLYPLLVQELLALASNQLHAVLIRYAS